MTLHIGEKTELVLIALTIGCLWFASDLLPVHIHFGRLLLWLSALLLFQSLVRDLWLLFSAIRETSNAQSISAQCMCIESAVGMIGVIAGLLFTGLGIKTEFKMNPETWIFLSLTTLITGFLIKDWVFEWNPWRIRRDPDHINIIVRWKK